MESGSRGTERDDATHAEGRRARSLIAALPEFAAVIPSGDRGLAERMLTEPLLTARDEDLAGVLVEHAGEAFDFLVVEGVVLKETTLARRAALELLGPGDVLAPPLTVVRQIESRAKSRYVAHGQVSLVALNARFRAAAQRWPALADVLHGRLGRQTHRASMHLAMLHLPRVEDRLVALFGDLAERFGHMTPDGILIDLPLTHDVIGELVGSRRSTVTIGLKALAAEGTLGRLADDRWMLAPRAIAP